MARTGLLWIAGVPLGCQSLRLAQQQYPYSQVPYGQQPYPAPPYGIPQQAQPPYGYPSYPVAPYGQPGASPYAPPYGSPYMPPYAQPSPVQPQAVVPPPVPAGPPAESTESTEATEKKDAHRIRTYLEGLLGGSKQQQQQQPRQVPMFSTANATRKMVKGSINFVRNTVRWVNETKHSNNTGEKLAELVKDIRPDTAKMIEKVAIPVLGNVALSGMPLTGREKVLANFGLGAAMMKVMNGNSSLEPLFGHDEHGNFANSSASGSGANTSASAEAAEAASKPRNRQTYLERVIRHWAARGE